MGVISKKYFNKPLNIATIDDIRKKCNTITELYELLAGKGIFTGTEDIEDSGLYNHLAEEIYEAFYSRGYDIAAFNFEENLEDTLEERLQDRRWLKYFLEANKYDLYQLFCALEDLGYRIEGV